MSDEIEKTDEHPFGGSWNEGNPASRTTPPDAATLKSLGNALYGELIGTLKSSASKLKPSDHLLIQKVALNAVKIRITGGTPVPPRKAKHVEAQLANVKAFASKVSADAFWEIVEKVLTRLSAFVLKI